MIEYPVRVLFLCSGNSARSQVAEALLQRKGGDRFFVASAGVNPASEIHPDTHVALSHLGIDLSGRKPKSVEAVSGEQWDLVITLCDRSKESCPSFANRPVTAHWGVPDSAAFADASRRRVAFTDAVGSLSWRIDLMLALRMELFERMVLQERLRRIGDHSGEPAVSRAVPPPATERESR